ncbi:universal stress protein [Chiayiivirga flava]|uniref:Nucleotide-binding universal stress UspA family protein n=1 Tax=Chiayiivirga flava TaxID=659595 RepID=A0A7W8D2Z0_9GAMM|nr:universal stress protein [Chiayiivirga flava]MBB5206532.1 nucleotide-binding universal stress UspA family protein [Chiayiivirga flava]
MLKDILVALTDTDGDRAALALAATIAQPFRAKVAALVTVQLGHPAAFEWRAMPASVYAEIVSMERERGEALAARTREALKAVDDAEVRIAESMLPVRMVAALHARHADLAVVAAPVGDTRDLMEDLAVDLLMQSGRPVLVVPPDHVRRERPLHAVIAWQPRREAARAVHDALPLLGTFATVDVLMVDPQTRETGHGEQPGADIAAHLARHGLCVNVVTLPRMGDTVEICILRHVVESGADLVVAGGYSHTRFREQILGGVTRTLLQGCPVPVLLSH